MVVVILAYEAVIFIVLIMGTSCSQCLLSYSLGNLTKISRNGGFSPTTILKLISGLLILYFLVSMGIQNENKELHR